MPRDPRTFITVHDGMPEHPKVESLSDAAFRLLIEAWCWCSRQLTDGQIPLRSWEKRGTVEARQELLDAGLAFAKQGASGCYIEMHDYTEHQRTSAEVEDLRSKRSEAGRRGGLAKASKSVASATADAKQTGSKPLAESETETDKESRPRKRGTRLPDGWIPSPEVRAAMAEQFPHVNLRLAHDKFTDYWQDQPGAKGVKLDWNGTWRNWIRSEAERTPTGRTNGQDQQTKLAPWTPEPPPFEIADDPEACDRWYRDQAAKRGTP